MEQNGSASSAERVHQNRLSGVTEDEDTAVSIVAVLGRVASVVDRVQASQARVGARHRRLQDAVRSVQTDLRELSQAHSGAACAVHELFQKTQKVSAHIKDVKARVERQQVHVKNVESRQEEIMKKNKFRVVIFQEEIRCPTSLSIVKDSSLAEKQEAGDEILDPPIDLSSDEEYYVEESRSAQLRKSGKEHIDNIKKAFSKENMQKTRQNLDKKVNRIRTRIVTPERRERLRQSGERLRQSGERFKKSISNAAPSREAFKIPNLRKGKDRTVAGVLEGVREVGVGPGPELCPDESSGTEQEQAWPMCPPREGEETTTPEPLRVTFKSQVKVEDDESLLLDLKPSS